ncbi:chromosome segregation protein SMC [Pseudahrensia aquimaris]|uniref:Chromosome partition protein Smc n=1 Tax=Pseudahrensia aquimaris TaxID=744461 RepID=A0ABW3FBT5_9HYPH
MEFNKLRLLGFKSFVEPTEFAIEKGLTGVVGPNGCGKSNLVEALRWVMGENSYKNMRASSMDDVIFSGSGNRPSRNTAEVALFLDNDDRTAPAAFNDADELQVSRRIEREAGSVYRINGKDVRAKDVQLLFADVSTGARSPSMIGQGRIGELISAKPQARRALLEEAAGISGLHSRRHEAELRLRAAEANLERLDDVIGQLETQLESLKRQARQANRYRNIAGDIRRAEATILHLKWSSAKAATAEAEKALTEATMKVGETQLVQTEAAKAQAIIASKLPQLREAEAKAAAALQHLRISRDQLEQEARRLERRRTELAGRIAQLEADIEREEQMIAENSDILSHLDREEKQLRAETEGRAEKEAATKQRLETVRDQLAQTEEQLSTLTREQASVQAQAGQLERTIREGSEREAKLDVQIADVANELATLSQQIASQSGVQEKATKVAQFEAELETAQAAVATSEQAAETARAKEQEARNPLAEARSEHDRIETEAKTLNRILNAGGKDLFPAVLEQMRADQGYEKALGAALGDDLDVPLEASAPAHWAATGAETANDPALPAGAMSLADKVKAPRELARRLAQIGVVSKEDGVRLSGSLKPGQRLVTRDGDLWRWDGYRATAEAPTAAAVRLEQKNRLAELDAEAIAALKLVREREATFSEAQAAASSAREAEIAARNALRTLQTNLDQSRKDYAAAEREVSDLTNRRSALEEAKVRLASSKAETEASLKEARAAQATLPNADTLDQQVAKARTKAGEERAALAEVRAEFEGMARENALRLERIEAIERERKAWNDRAVNADRQMKSLRERLAEAVQQKKDVDDAPSDIEERGKALSKQIDEAEAARKQAADFLAEMENDQREADKVANGALNALSDAKQISARAEERLEAARERRAEIEARIREDLECQAHEAFKQTGLDDENKLPELDAVERKLERLKSERERLGAVNLRAEEEQNEILEQRDTMVNERDDLIEAIKELRTGINSLNKEGRERLLTAFDEVNEQFQKLFTHLFGGGTAELQLVESDDPLEAGLEILARPPGKKPQTMTLLSGGEQALTAMALIFAVFLTNPAPICVLDEVDAPLDDHNVERFCNLMDQMAENTDTRFVIITHNPITMARMNRLFGVTMAERGVSQLVSVDLETAESFREAG